MRISRIGRRLLGWFSVVALIPVLFMGYQGYLSSREAIHQEATQRMETIAATKVSRINQWFDERHSDLLLVAANTRLREEIVELNRNPNEESLSRIVEELEAYRSRSQAYSYLCLYNPAGDPWCCTEISDSFIPDFVGSKLYRSVKNSNEPKATSIHPDDTIGPMMQMAVRIPAKDGSALGIVVASLALSGTLNPIILDSTGLGKSGEAYVVDSERWMLTPSRFMNHPAPLTHKMDSEGIRQGIKGVNGSAIYEGWYGKDVLGAWIYMPGQNWVLLAEISVDEAFTLLNQLRRTTILVALLTLAGVLIIVLFVSRSLGKPIEELAAASRDIASGNLDRTADIVSKDELGELAERFNQMVQSLKSAREKEKLAAIGEMTASIVHEIRNPLSSIKMNLQIIESKQRKTSALAEHLNLAKSQAARLEQMLNELLEFSRPVQVKRDQIKLCELLRTCTEDFRSRENEAVRIKGLDNLPDLRIIADREMLRRAILNVLLNAAQAMKGNGEIHLSASKQKDSIEIHFQDCGPGIPDETLERIFEPFFTTRPGGTGLGLANTQKILQAHGGTVKIESNEIGTLVVFEIPEFHS